MTTTTPGAATPTSQKRDLWTRFIESTVRVVEKLCPPLEKTLRWDFVNCGSLLSLEEEYEDRDGEGAIAPHTSQVRDIHEEMSDFLPHAATAA